MFCSCLTGHGKKTSKALFSLLDLALDGEYQPIDNFITHCYIRCRSPQYFDDISNSPFWRHRNYIFWWRTVSVLRDLSSFIVGGGGGSGGRFLGKSHGFQGGRKGGRSVLANRV